MNGLKTTGKQPPGVIASAYLLGLLILVAPPIVGYEWFANADGLSGNADGLSGAVFGTLISGLGLFLYLFTGEICRRRMVWMIRYSYLFIPVLMLAVTAVPFVIAQRAPLLENLMHNSTIGVVKACRQELKGADKPPPEIQCSEDGERYQWVVNVGGYFDNSRKDTQPHEPASLELPAHHVTQTVFVSLSQANKDAVVGDWQQRYGLVAADNRLTGKESPTVAPSLPGEIQGGLVVPLYIVVVALIGGVVCMMRRVPVIQLRVSDWFDMDNARQAKVSADESHKGEAESSKSSELPVCMQDYPLDPKKARECLIFQMMQALSAPFIAMIAYFFLAPHSFSVGLGIAFVSGFASETILLAIMAQIDKTINHVSN